MRGWSCRPAIYYFIIYSPQTNSLNSPHLQQHPHSGLPFSLHVSISLDSTLTCTWWSLFCNNFPFFFVDDAFRLFTPETFTIAESLYLLLRLLASTYKTHTHFEGKIEEYITSDVFGLQHCTALGQHQSRYFVLLHSDFLIQRRFSHCNSCTQILQTMERLPQSRHNDGQGSTGGTHVHGLALHFPTEFDTLGKLFRDSEGGGGFDCQTDSTVTATRTRFSVVCGSAPN